MKKNQLYLFFFFLCLIVSCISSRTIVKSTTSHNRIKTISVFKNNKIVEVSELDSNNILITRTYYYYHDYNNNISEAYIENDNIHFLKKKGTVLYEEYGFDANGNIKVCRIGYESTNYDYYITWYENGNIRSYGFLGIVDSNINDYHNEYDSINVYSNSVYLKTPAWFVKNGKWIYFKENGMIDRKEYYDNGHKIYIWKFYDDNGNINRLEYYEDGILVKSKLY